MADETSLPLKGVTWTTDLADSADVSGLENMELAEDDGVIREGEAAVKVLQSEATFGILCKDLSTQEHVFLTTVQ